MFTSKLLTSLLLTFSVLQGNEKLPDSNKIIGFFEKTFGKHNSQRRNHLTGFCFSGEFIPNKGKINEYSKSNVFIHNSQVNGRFSHKDGIKLNESKVGHLGMAISFDLPFQENFITTLNTLDFFPASTAEAFYQIMKYKATKDKELLKSIKQTYPELVKFKKYYKKNPIVLKGYENSQYNSVNSFVLVNNKGKRKYVRWSFVPRDLNNVINQSKTVDFYTTLKKKLSNSSAQWDMIIILANDEDKVNDPSIMWSPQNHTRINAGTLIVSKISKKGSCNDVNFDPLILPSGIKPSEDSVLIFRSSAYAISFGKRLGEKLQNSK